MRDAVCKHDKMTRPNNESTVGSDCPVIDHAEEIWGLTAAPTFEPPTAAPTMSPTINCALERPGEMDPSEIHPSWWRHQKLVYPEEIKSDDPVMEIYVEVDVTRYIGAVNFTTRAYCVNGKCHIPAPTIRTKPGQNVTMIVANKLGNETKHHMEMNTFEFPNHTNVHTHGMHIDPYIDNIALDIKPGENWTYYYHVFENHAPGLFWWHSHMHGSSMLQIGGGMSGTWTVDPDNASYAESPEFYEIPEHVIVLQHFKFGREFGDPCDHGLWIQEGGRFNQFKVYTLDEMADLFDTFSPNAESMLESRNPWYQYVPNSTYNVTQFWAVNGQYEPIMEIQAGELHILRIVNAGSGWAMHVAIPGCTTWLIARDGVYRDEKKELDSIVIMMSARADIMVQCPCEGLYYMESAGYNYNNQMDVYDEDDTKLLILNVTGENWTDHPPNLPGRREYLEDLMSMHRYKFQDFHTVDFFQERPKDMPDCVWVMNEDTYRGGEFYHHHSNLNDYAEWLLEGKGSATHPYHQHVNHFQVVYVEKDDPTGGAIYEIGEWRDVMPALQGKIVIRFRNHDLPGPMIYHCHFLSHEDRGMMHINFVHHASEPYTVAPTSEPTVYAYEDLSDDEIDEFETAASKLFAYITGSVSDANYLPTGKPSQYFGFPYVRYELSLAVSKAAIGYIFLNEISESLRQVFRDATDYYMQEGGIWDKLTEVRAKQIDEIFMLKNDSSHTINMTYMIELGKQQYYWDGQLGIVQAEACLSVYSHLSSSVKSVLEDVREGQDYTSSYDQDTLNGDVSDGAQLKNTVAKCFAWITGDLEACQHIVSGRSANFFGFIKMRDEDEDSDNLRSEITEITLNALSDEQLQILYRLAKDQHSTIEDYDFSRDLAVALMWDYFDEGELNEEQFLLFCEDYGIYDAILATYQAEAFEEIRDMLTANQLEYFHLIRAGYNDSQVGYLVSDAPTAAPTLAPTEYCADGHSEKIGYALDGFPIYGPYSCGGNVPDDLDECHGHDHGMVEGYHYHTTAEFPYIIGCFHGQVLCKTVKNHPGDCVRKEHLLDTTLTRQTIYCDEMNTEFHVRQAMIEVPWSVDEAKIPTTDHCGTEFCHKHAAYSWELFAAMESEKIGAVECVEVNGGDESFVVINSAGIPDHMVATFPLNHKGGTTGLRDKKDATKPIRYQDYEWKIPKYPVAYQGKRTSILNNSDALPWNKVIGFALNGVPFYSPVTSNGEPAFYENNTDFVVQDLCYGSTDGNGEYNYRRTPWCLLNNSQPNTTVEWFEAHAFAEVFPPTVAPTPAPTAYCAPGHSEKIGYALDGYPIYGPYSCGGLPPDDLDVCNGHEHSTVEGFHYHTTPNFPYVIGCFHGQVLCEMSGNRVKGCLKHNKLLQYLEMVETLPAELNCSSVQTEFVSRGQMQLVPWKVDATKVPTYAHCGYDFCDPDAAYSWNYSLAYKKWQNDISCGYNREHPFFLEVNSNGVPDHYTADFPLDWKNANNTPGTLGTGDRDVKRTIRQQSWTWYIPRTPLPYTAGDRTSVYEDVDAISQKDPIGFALNGVPFYGPFVDDEPAFNHSSSSFVVTDMCHGTVEKSGAYVYRSTPWCLAEDMTNDTATWFIAHGLRHKLSTPAPTFAPTLSPTISKQPTLVPTVAPTLSPTAACLNHSEILGYALDGYPIYGPYTCGGVLPDDLDQCNGHEHDDLEGYHYHVTPTYPYIIGCFHGVVLCDTNFNMDCVSKASNLELTSSSNDLSCDSINEQFEAHTGTTLTQLPWAVNESNIPSFVHCGRDYCDPLAAYSWDLVNTVATDYSGFASCNETTDSEHSFYIRSNGVPDHVIAEYPLSYSSGTLGLGTKDMPKSFEPKSYLWEIPSKPTPYSGNRTSIVDDPDALPSDVPIGFAVNGVPFVVSFHNAFNSSDPSNFKVLDYCYGDLYNKEYYGYRSIPWCLISTDLSQSNEVWRAAHGLS